MSLLSTRSSSFNMLFLLNVVRTNDLILYCNTLNLLEEILVNDLNIPFSKNSIGESISTAAIEVGYGDTKSAYRNALGRVIMNSIPSITPPYSSKVLSGSLGKRSTLNTFEIKVGHQSFEIGPDVMASVGGTINTGRNVGEQFPETPEYEALVLGAIALMNASNIGHLILGLPVHNMLKYADYLKNKFASTFLINNRMVTIERVTVLPQPIGTLVRLAALQQAPLTKGVNRLIIDPGYYSTDWIVANGFQISEKRSSGTVCGISHILTEASKYISADYGLKFERIERLGAALREKTSLSLHSVVIDNPTLWKYIERCDHIIIECLKVIEQSVGEMDDIAEVTLTGGGGVFFTRLCEARYKNQKVDLIGDARYANVIGFLLQGEN